MRASFNGPASNVEVDKQLGSAYQVVKKVYENLDKLQDNAALATDTAEALETAKRVEIAVASIDKVAQHAVDVANGVDAKATQAESDAALAVTKAADAVSVANGIDAKATEAQADATAAVAKATQAETVATGIEAKADDAISKATSAETIANDAEAKAVSAEAKATAATSAAGVADGKAVAANTAAAAADAKAVAAQDTANTAITRLNQNTLVVQKIGTDSVCLRGSFQVTAAVHAVTTAYADWTSSGIHLDLTSPVYVQVTPSAAVAQTGSSGNSDNSVKCMRAIPSPTDKQELKWLIQVLNDTGVSTAVTVYWEVLGKIKV